MKTKPFTLPVNAGSILVCGSSRSARTLFNRITEAAKTDPACPVSFSVVPITGYDYIYSTAPIPLDIARACRETMVISDDSAEGKTRGQESLTNCDWQALRDVERQLLAMHKAGVWTLPDDVCRRIIARESTRGNVDQDIQALK